MKKGFVIQIIVGNGPQTLSTRAQKTIVINTRF